MPKDYYAILGVSKTSSEDEIKKSFRRLAHEHHPDKGGDAKKFKDVNEAYQVLGNKEKRATYDRFGSAAFEQGNMGGPGGPGGFGGFGGFDFGGQGFSINMDDLGDLGDALGGMFGMGGRNNRRNRGADLEVQVRLTFLESVTGVEKSVPLYRKTACDVCNGSGGEPDAGTKTCSKCNGQGRVQQQQRTLFGVMNTVGTCPDCAGQGKIPEKACKHCGGTGAEKREETIKIKIPGGISDGEAVKVTGQGEHPGKGGQAGDLYVRIRVTAHPEFVRQEQDILSTAYVPFSIMALGGKVDVNTVDGPISLKIPEHTAAGSVFRLREKGFPTLRGYGRGDHSITVLPDVPKKLSREQKKVLEGLGEMGL